MKSQIVLCLFSFGFVLTLISCEQSNQGPSEIEDSKSEEFDLAAAKKNILKKTIRFTEAHISKDTAYLNNIFSEDARILPPNSEMVVGKKDIAALNYDWVNYGIYEFEETSTNFYGGKNYLIDEGTYYLRYGAENIVDKGKYINIWKNIDGEWKIYSNIWNSSLAI